MTVFLTYPEAGASLAKNPVRLVTSRQLQEQMEIIIESMSGIIPISKL